MKRAFRSCLLAILVCGMVRVPATGQNVISADRPGVSTPPSLVPQNGFQFELGFAFERSNQSGTTTRSYSWNQSLFRFGLLSFAEIRLATYYVKTEVLSSEGTSTVNGFGPLALGTKVALFKEKGLRPQTSLMANALLPKTGLEAYRVKNLAPSVFLLFQNDLSAKLVLGYNIGLLWDGESHAPSTFYAINLGLNLSGKLSCYAENFGYLNPSGNAFYLDAGLAYLLTPRMQLDVSGGLSTKGGHRDVQFSAGFSWLIF